MRCKPCVVAVFAIVSIFLVKSYLIFVTFHDVLSLVLGDFCVCVFFFCHIFEDFLDSMQFGLVLILPLIPSCSHLILGILDFCKAEKQI